MFLDPCNEETGDVPKCGKNAFCNSTSATTYTCLCPEDWYPINHNARLYGCQIDKNQNTTDPPVITGMKIMNRL